MIWVNKQIDGVSLISWGLFTLLAIPLLLYALVHKDVKLIIMYSLNILLNVAVVAGVIMYGWMRHLAS